VRYARNVGKLLVVFFFIALLYTGYRLDAAKWEADSYNEEFGYQTPTVGLTGCVCNSPAWHGILIDSTISFTDGAHNLEPFDIDGDGDLELVANSFRADKLMMYDPAHDPRNPRNWTRHVVDSCVGGGFARRPLKTYVKSEIKGLLTKRYIAGGAHYTAIADLNGDGRADLVVACDEMCNDVVWYEAGGPTGGEALSWVKHVACRDDSHRTYHVETGDIDGDGDRDIVFTSKTDESLGWLENRGSPDAWPAVIIDSNCPRCFYARVQDLDGDGRGEIIASEDNWHQHGKLCLYSHAGSPQKADNWRKVYIAHLPPGHGLSVFKVLDLDGDGAFDIAAAGHQGDVCVLRNPGPANVFGRWEMHFVTRGGPDKRRDFREIDVGDIDLDGDPDIVVADEAQNAVVWYENPGTTFRDDDWPEHIVDQSNVYLRWCHCVRLADIDKDGDLDIAVAAAASNVFLLYFNEMAPHIHARVAGVTAIGK
jgi:hypothetical protein